MELKNSKFPDSIPRGVYGSMADRKSSAGRGGGRELAELKNSKFPDSIPRGVYGSMADRKSSAG